MENETKVETQDIPQVTMAEPVAEAVEKPKRWSTKQKFDTIRLELETGAVKFNSKMLAEDEAKILRGAIDIVRPKK